jgi:hypothetical protein
MVHGGRGSKGGCASMPKCCESKARLCSAGDATLLGRRQAVHDMLVEHTICKGLLRKQIKGA